MHPRHSPFPAALRHPRRRHLDVASPATCLRIAGTLCHSAFLPIYADACAPAPQPRHLSPVRHWFTAYMSTLPRDGSFSIHDLIAHSPPSPVRDSEPHGDLPLSPTSSAVVLDAQRGRMRGHHTSPTVVRVGEETRGLRCKPPFPCRRYTSGLHGHPREDDAERGLLSSSAVAYLARRVAIWIRINLVLTGASFRFETTRSLGWISPDLRVLFAHVNPSLESLASPYARETRARAAAVWAGRTSQFAIRKSLLPRAKSRLRAGRVVHIPPRLHAEFRAVWGMRGGKIMVRRSVLGWAGKADAHVLAARFANAILVVAASTSPRLPLGLSPVYAGAVLLPCRRFSHDARSQPASGLLGAGSRVRCAACLHFLVGGTPTPPLTARACRRIFVPGWLIQPRSNLRASDLHLPEIRGFD
ncbi:hypothetical protein K438DRAFT_1956444 [Mycena galopus ATCC 62051]|nr:hypothetical protein K438DRAFT_1956444 [Mycena galopus ATCC 62051]